MEIYIFIIIFFIGLVAACIIREITAFDEDLLPEQKDAPKQEKNDIKPLPDFYIGYAWGHYLINVPRSFSLKFRGDIYNYDMLFKSSIIKIYTDTYHEKVMLLKDIYGRLWLNVYHDDGFDDRIEETFDLVKDEQEANSLSKRNTYHYMGEPPFIHATELNDFILHEDPTEEIPGYIERKKKEIIELNQ